MGLIIIEALVEQLEAKMEIIREGGTDIRLTFPLPS
jgi:two-component sensor histidine kinase